MDLYDEKQRVETNTVSLKVMGKILKPFSWICRFISLKGVFSCNLSRLVFIAISHRETILTKIL